jgi:isoamylase
VDTFAADRGPLASINFVTAHDGFTLADLTAYNGKHNLDNGEDNRDGTDNNRSWNHGPEGATSDAGILAGRRRSIRNLLGTLLFSTGVPMLVAGDEFGRGQQGNNNPYSQDNEISWLDWQLEPWQEDLLATTRYLLSLRRQFPALGSDRFFTGQPPEGSRAGLKDLSWYAPDGSEMAARHWQDGGLRMLQVLFADPALADAVPAATGTEPAATGAEPAASTEPASSGGSLLMVIAGAAYRADVVLPSVPPITGYELLWGSAEARPPATRQRLLAPRSRVSLPPDSVHLYRAL